MVILANICGKEEEGEWGANEFRAEQIMERGGRDKFVRYALLERDHALQLVRYENWQMGKIATCHEKSVGSREGG